MSDHGPVPTQSTAARRGLSYDPFPHYGRLWSTGRGRRLIAKCLPLHLWYRLRAECSLIGVILSAGLVRRRLRGRRGVRLNIAPGGNPFAGWVNIDVIHAPGIDYRYDCRKDLPLDDGAADAVYCEHFFEHLEHSEEAQRFLAECRRVLRPGGILRLVVPDGEAYLKAYVTGGEAALRSIVRDEEWFDGKWETPMDLINLVARQGIEHHYLYDRQTLELMLRRYGFAPQQACYGVSAIPDFPGDSASRRNGSLYIEALAPGTPSGK